MVRLFSSGILILLTIVLFANPPYARGAERDFPAWLAELKREAVREGVSAALLEEVLTGITPREDVLSRDRNQPEFKFSLEDYLGRVVSERRVRKGREMMAEHRQLLEEIAARYKIQARFLVALWGIETDYGRILGDFPVIESLVTLAFDPRRSAYFRRELLHALHILDEGMVPLPGLKGSWAGAIGGLQFMPSVCRRYAVDYDGDGNIDLWRDPGDLFASAANYLHASGWRDDQTWGREVYLPENFDRSLAGHETRLKIAGWQELGVRRYHGRRNLPEREMSASLIIPDRQSGRAFLVYDNFEAILKWNRSDLFGLAVGFLADRLQE